MDPVLLATTLIVVFGVAGQYIGRLVGVPSLLVLLVLGALLGPGFGWLDPSEAYGQDEVLTLASLGVGLLLFEGGLQLRWSEFHSGIRRPLALLITLGVVLTVAAGTALCLWVLDVSATQALLLGAILSVSGPTVVGPLIRASKPREPTGTLLRWEGILIDPIGAMLSVTVLSVWFVVDDPDGFVGFLLASVGGVAIGLGCAACSRAAAPPRHPGRPRGRDHPRDGDRGVCARPTGGTASPASSPPPHSASRWQTSALSVSEQPRCSVA